MALKIMGEMLHVQPLEEMGLHQVDHQDRYSLLSYLKSCGKQKDLHKTINIHSQILQKKLFLKDVYVNTALISAYSKCGALAEAQQVFNQLPIQNVVSWTALISGYAHHGLGNEAIDRFRQMRDEGIPPNSVTFISILKACSSIGSTLVGEEIHGEIKKLGLLKENLVLGTSLVDMYAKCGQLNKARKVFDDELPVHDVVAWNSLLTGYVRHGLGQEALDCFRKMRDHGLCPDKVTYICILKACSSIRSPELGQEIDAEIRKQGLLGKDITLDTSLVDMYAKCGMLDKAKELFDKLPKRNVVTWTALITGYAHYELMDEALDCFMRMREERVMPNSVTFICILKACGSIGALKTGEEIHTEVSKQGLLQRDIVIGTAMMDMYAKCGMLGKAQHVFNELPLHDVVSWNALIAGYAQLGQVKLVFGLISKMTKEGILPDEVTFLVLLTVSSHAGLVEEGHVIFDKVCAYYASPTLEHYACMVDILSRAGHFDKSVALIEKVQVSDRLQLWLALLGACQVWINEKLGRWAYEQLINLNEKCAAAYIGMGNIHAAFGVQETAHNGI